MSPFGLLGLFALGYRDGARGRFGGRRPLAPTALDAASVLITAAGLTGVLAFTADFSAAFGALVLPVLEGLVLAAGFAAGWPAGLTTEAADFAGCFLATTWALRPAADADLTPIFAFCFLLIVRLP